ncbi:DNA-binding transcriptional regulator, LysR family [Paracoccus halophilus]|uniref:DNA-binding transcriptional regulator, LysR family n=1 Tax=Paracoccus halophilus TaxID=376733 RepID=A0A099EX75_9RHOB|nr:LysR family transcriptional regulator [Paracoccus halophilus]KGJ02849.1 LysR family transcriptional regulator [Paracoccus halophilus]SFA60196.1 DNA-binding transcriptional regulator, LysR family [Paracoccus halophilus]
MHQRNLRSVDLNLLVVLEALLAERNVTRAAKRLGLSQPATSRALGRLRAVLGDKLLAEGAGGYSLTPRAVTLEPVLKSVLTEISGMLDAQPFDPATAQGRIRLMTPDLHAAGLLSPLLAQITEAAPGLDIEVPPLQEDPLSALENDQIDAVIGVMDTARSGIQRRALFDDRYVCLLRAGHPAIRQGFSIDDFLACDHVVVAITDVGPTTVDETLAGQGLTRRVRVRIPSFLAAMDMVSRSELVMTLPETLARTADVKRFAILPPPMDLPGFTMSLLWHKRYQDAPPHIWLREAIVTAAASIMSDR